MKNPQIARVLKYYRKLNNLSVNRVSELLTEYGSPAAPKTIYGWENGSTQPDADTLMLLCELYHIENILESFGYKEQTKKTNLILTEHEKNLILKYRENTAMQPAVDKLLNLADFKIGE
ncbi:MAG: helix-turn-helix transcriptional regulator [Lachnospiraceae bacterium]|nr:helix-turn-helix transcriptional regulator [Lachnospiraceae bacterium]